MHTRSLKPVGIDDFVARQFMCLNDTRAFCKFCTKRGITGKRSMNAWSEVQLDFFCQ